MHELTKIPGTDMPRRMGRKPLGVKETKMRLPIGLPERIDALVGEQKRADYIRRALVEAVERDEQAQQAPVTK